MSSMANGESSAVKVIGFKLKESPDNDDAPSTAHVTSHTGSPLPVTIPPPFKTPRGNAIDQHCIALEARVEPTTDNVMKTDPPRTSSELTRQIHPTAKTDSGQKTKSTMKAKPGGSNTGGNSRKESSQKKAKPSTKPANPVLQKTTETKTSAQCLSLFDHLDPFKPFSRDEVLRREEVAALDPAFVQFCIEYGERRMHESRACKEMLAAFYHAVHWFHNDASLFYTREYLAFLNHYIAFLIRCRALNIAMRNSIRIVKVEVTKLKSEIPLEEGKEAVRRLLKGIIEERVDVLQIIAKEADALIKDDDVILTYAFSDTVLSVLSYARQQQGKRLRVVVVDAWPDRDGKQLLRKLIELGIPCTYVLINALGFALKDVTKVTLGASAVMSNGTVVSRAGSASIAMMARSLNIPIVVCSQTLKFHERVQLDAFTQNELGDTTAMLPDGASTENRQYLGLLNLRYDLMPSTFVSIIVSELGFTPAHSVSVFLREQSCDKDMVLI